MRRLPPLVPTLLIAALTLAGCGGGSKDSGSAGERAAFGRAQGEVLRICLTRQPGKGLDAVQKAGLARAVDTMAAFKRKYPDATFPAQEGADRIPVDRALLGVASQLRKGGCAPGLARKVEAAAGR